MLLDVLFLMQEANVMGAKYLTVEDVAGQLNVSTWTVIRLILKGEPKGLKGLKMGGQWRIHPDDLARYTGHPVETTAEPPPVSSKEPTYVSEPPPRSAYADESLELAYAAGLPESVCAAYAAGLLRQKSVKDLVKCKAWYESETGRELIRNLTKNKDYYESDSGTPLGRIPGGDTVPLLGPDGEPVLGPDGHSVLGLDGKPLRGGNGEVLRPILEYGSDNPRKDKPIMKYGKVMYSMYEPF